MTAEQLISFARCAPSLDIIDVEGLKAAAARAFDADPAGMTAYGTSVGYVPLRKWIAEKHGVSADQVIVTNGSLQADAFLFNHLVQPGDTVIVEKPTYDRTLLSLQNLGAKVHQVTLQADGIDTEELRALLESGVRPKLAHIIPNYQNPAGLTLSEQKRHDLIALAVEYGFTIFENDPYVDIRFRGEALPSMLSMAASSDKANNTVVHASKGLCWPNERLPEIRTRTSAMTNTTQALAAICQKARSDPSPNTNSINDCIVPPRP